MKIYSFNELAEEKKREIFTFTQSFEYRGSLKSYEEMAAYYGGIAFNNGSSHFSLWEDDRLVGTLGVVSKEAAVRGEIFLVSISFKEPDSGKLALLLHKAFDYCSDIKSARYRLGIMYDRYYLVPAVEESGFREAYRNLEMAYCGSDVLLPEEEDKCFRNLTPQNIRDFQKVHNASFLQAPNGSIIEDSELRDYLDEYCGSELAGIYYGNDEPAGIYMLKLKEDSGYIDSIGVAPEFQGKGIGKKLLGKSVRVLQDAGREKIELSVFNVNKRAVDLYLKNGFEVESEHSVWYER